MREILIKIQIAGEGMEQKIGQVVKCKGFEEGSPVVNSLFLAGLFGNLQKLELDKLATLKRKDL